MPKIYVTIIKQCGLLQEYKDKNDEQQIKMCNTTRMICNYN